jgi:hypothetical protein
MEERKVRMKERKDEEGKKKRRVEGRQKVRDIRYTSAECQLTQKAMPRLRKWRDHTQLHLQLTVQTTRLTHVV